MAWGPVYPLNELRGITAPSRSKVHEMKTKSHNEAVVLIDVWMSPFRDGMENRAVKKT